MIQPSNGESRSLFGEIETQHIGPAAAGAAGEHDPTAQTYDCAAQQAAGKHVPYQGLGRDRCQAEGQTVDRDAQEAAGEKFPAQGPEGQQEDGDIEQVVENTGKIVAVGDAQRLVDQRPDQLAHAQDSTGI